MIKVYNKKVCWPSKGSADDDLCFRNLIARYSGFPNVVWDFSKEAHNEKDLDYKTGRLRYVRQHDPFRRLITVHDDNPAYESGLYDQLVDYRSDRGFTCRNSADPLTVTGQVCWTLWQKVL